MPQDTGITCQKVILPLRIDMKPWIITKFNFFYNIVPKAWTTHLCVYIEMNYIIKFSEFINKNNTEYLSGL